MPETYGIPEPERTRVERVKPIVRAAIAGHEQASVRRIVLWVLLFTFIGGTMVIPVLALPAIVAGALLALTDQLV